MKNILLITQGFPYGESEKSFIESEYNELIKQFNVFILPITNHINAEPIPNVFPFEYKQKNRIHKLFCLLHREVYQEYALARKKANINNRKIRFKEILDYYSRAALIVPSLENIIVEKNIDIVYSYWCLPATYAAARLKKKHHNLKVVSRFHGFDLFNERTKGNWQPFRYYLSEKLDSLFFVSQAGLDYYCTTWKKGGTVRYLGSNDFSINSRFTKNSNRLIMISCSNTIPLKRIDLIIEALASIEQNIHLEWHHFGDGPLLNKLQELAKKKIVNHSISYTFHGFCDQSELKQAYNLLRPELFITTSSTEGCPVSIMEAFSMGIPAIGTDVGGIPELVKPGETGILLSSDPSINEIRDAILSFYNMNEIVYNQMSCNSRKLWEEFFDARKNAVSFVKELDTI